METEAALASWFQRPSRGRYGSDLPFCVKDDDMKPSNLVIFTRSGETPLFSKALCSSVSSTEASCFNHNGCCERMYDKFSVHMEPLVGAANILACDWRHGAESEILGRHYLGMLHRLQNFKLRKAETETKRRIKQKQKRS